MNNLIQLTARLLTVFTCSLFFACARYSSVHSNNGSLPINKAFPGVFPPSIGILVSPSTIHGIPDSYQIDPFPESENNRNHYDSRNESTVKYLIMHYTVCNFPQTVNLFTANKDNNRVSAHYVISEKDDHIAGGKLLQVVPDEMRAWHAGVSRWGTYQNLNPVSLGIEYVNKGFTDKHEGDKVYYPFDEDQIKTSGLMSRQIVQEYNIAPQNVLGHQDIAPSRKSDPGPLFPWAKLYNEYGVGAWLDENEMNEDDIMRKYHPERPSPETPDLDVLLEIVSSYGYPTETATDTNIVNAFKAHFSANQSPELCDGKIRKEDMFWAWAIEAKYGSSH